MNTNTSEFLKKWGGLLVTLVLLILATILIRHTGKPPAMVSPDAAVLTPGLTASSTASSTVSEGASATPIVGVSAVPVIKNQTYQDPAWSIRFTLRPEWNVNVILDNARKTHQLQIASNKLVIFISKDEAIGLSDNLKYTTSTRTIDGQSVSVRTYSNPSTEFALYQLFTIKRPDGAYWFLIKNTTTNTAQTDAFLNSISNNS